MFIGSSRKTLRVKDPAAAQQFRDKRIYEDQDQKINGGYLWNNSWNIAKSTHLAELEFGMKRAPHGPVRSPWLPRSLK